MVATRFPNQPFSGGREVGHLVVGAPYTIAEVVCQVSGRDFRTGLTYAPREGILP
jgi:hypothetical protein